MRLGTKSSIAAAIGIALVVSGVTATSAQAASKKGVGPITYVQGKDNNNIVRPAIAKWNAAHPDQKVTFKEQTAQADQQLKDLENHEQAKSSAYDVMSVDNIWTSEFAAKGWLVPLKGKYKLPTGSLLPATVKAATYHGTLYVGPTTSDGGLLYYRSDLVKTPPTSWDDMMSDCSIAKQNGIDCYAGQYAQYEGLTVNVAEAINTAGGKIVNSKGAPTVTSADAQKGLQRLVTAVQDGNIPKAALGWQEEDGRQAFDSGKLLFMRNWPYAYSLSNQTGSAVIGKFAVAPLPGNGGGKPGVSSLGGHAAGISSYSKHKVTALNFIKYLESTANQKFWLQKGSAAPVRASLYNNAALVKQYPYLPTLLTSIQNAEPRPVSPFYPAITKAVEDNATNALSGKASVSSALSSMQAAIKASSSS